MTVAVTSVVGTATISPAAQRIIADAFFDRDGDHYYVEDRFGCGGDPVRDVLIIRGVESNGCDDREVRWAVQVHDLEGWIAQDRVDIPFGPPALLFNIVAGWSATDEDHEAYRDLITFDETGRRRITLPEWW